MPLAQLAHARTDEGGEVPGVALLQHWQAPVTAMYQARTPGCPHWQGIDHARIQP